MQAAHPCTVSAAIAALASARLVDDFSSCGRSRLRKPQRRPEGVASVPSSWPAPTRGSAAGWDDPHGQARTESVRPAVDLEKQWTAIHDHSGSLQLPLPCLKAALRPGSHTTRTGAAGPTLAGWNQTGHRVESRRAAPPPQSTAAASPLSASGGYCPDPRERPSGRGPSPGPSRRVVVKIRGSVADQAWAAVLFLQAKANPPPPWPATSKTPSGSASSVTGPSSTRARTSRP